jgi:hypothetical protein
MKHPTHPSKHGFGSRKLVPSLALALIASVTSLPASGIL